MSSTSSETTAGRLKRLVAAHPGGMTHGEVLAAMPDISSGLLRVMLHRLRINGDLKPSISIRGGRAPLVQVIGDSTPPRNAVALHGAAAFIVRRVLAGGQFARMADLAAEFDRVLGDDYKRGNKAVYALRQHKVLAKTWPLVMLPDADISFED